MSNENAFEITSLEPNQRFLGKMEKGFLQLNPEHANINIETECDLAFPPGENKDNFTKILAIHKKSGILVAVLDRTEELNLLGLKIPIKSIEKEEWIKVVSQINVFSQSQLTDLKGYITEMGSTIKRDSLLEAIQKVISKTPNKDTFALPSHPVMFALWALFAGRPDKIPRRLLSKPHKDWTEEEKNEAEAYLNSIISTEKKESFVTGELDVEEKRIAIISDNPRVEAKAEISTSLFREDVFFREFSLATYIKRSFGPEGLRHLLGCLIGLEENFRKGYFEWSVNEHLERLGYRKKPYGSFDPELKKAASEIIKVFQSLFITARKKDGKKEVIQGERLFSIDGFRQETFDKVIIDERIKLRATDFWYRHAFEPQDGQSGKYTKLLKKIVKESHQDHPLTIYLAPLLAIFWRMNPERKISVTNLMDWCDQDHQGKYKLRYLRNLESELTYMKEKGYLGGWNSDGESPFPSDCQDPFNCNLVLTPPLWLETELQLIQKNNEMPAVEGIKEDLITLEELQFIYEKSKLSMQQFGNHLGIGRTMVSYLLKGTRSITKGISDKVKEFERSQAFTKPTSLSH